MKKKFLMALTPFALMLVFVGFLSLLLPHNADSSGRKGGAIPTGGVKVPSGAKIKPAGKPVGTTSNYSKSSSGGGDSIKAREAPQKSTGTTQKTTRGGGKALTNPQARKAAKKLGYKKTTDYPSQMDTGPNKVRSKALVFKGKLPERKTKTFISPDSDGHHFTNGWKVWNNKGRFLFRADHSLTKFKKRK